MQIRRFLACLAGVALAALMAVPTVSAQPPGGGPGGPGGPGGFGRGGNLLDLAMNEAVQKEIEALEEQVAKITALRQQLRADAPAQERIDFRNLSEAEREKALADMRERSVKQAAAAKEKLAEILLPPQMERLEEISLQQQGVNALANPDVAAKLNLTAAQKQRIETAISENRTQMQGLFQGGAGGDREQMRARLTQFRTEADNKLLAVLTAEQKKKFEELKGEPFEMPQRTFGAPGAQGRPGAPGAQGGRGPGAQGGRGPGAQGGRGPGARGPGARGPGAQGSQP